MRKYYIKARKRCINHAKWGARKAGEYAIKGDTLNMFDRAQFASDMLKLARKFDRLARSCA